MSIGRIARTVYILQLRGGKYYVGKTTDLGRRLAEHVAGIGSVWTAKYPMMGVVQTIPNANAFEEDRWVKEMMSHHGIDNVRGGAYSNRVLDFVQCVALQRELWSAADRCLRCGSSDHRIGRCPTLRQ